MQNNLQAESIQLNAQKSSASPLKEIFITIDKLFILTASLFNTIA